MIDEPPDHHKLPLVRAAVRLTTVFVLVLSLGLHWALLQTLAWTGMIVSYSRDASLREAISMTFDGEHPCSLCKVIKQGRSEERKPNQQKPDKGVKLEFPLPDGDVIFIVPTGAEDLPVVAMLTSSLPAAPPTPPPRSAAV